MEEKLKLYGFNNLTKALSFNIYDICYAKSAREQQDYIKYIDEQYNSERLTNILGDTILAHLDKSHVTVHTYPEFHPGTSIATFRVDIDVATCGEITPLKTLDYMIAQFDSDIITMDYRVRGFTRDLDGRKLFMDSKMRSIQEFIAKETLDRYDAVDINLYQANLYHTRMLIKEPQLQNYLFNTDIYEIPPKDRLAISNSLRREMIEIYSGRNLY